MPDPQGSGTPHTTLADLGEWGLLERLRAWAPPGQFDDDAALLQERPDGVLAVSTDVLVEGLHFSDATMGPLDLGWRAAAANLSDLAAMGCREVVGLTVGLVAPPSTPFSWVEGVYAGLRQALDRHGGILLGGDCSGGAQRLLAITALGRLGSEGPIRRADARPGDVLISTGPHGLSRLGLALLQNQLPAGAVPPPLAARAIAAHRHPQPRLDAVAALAESRPRQQRWRVAGTDSSDGLAAAVALLASGSDCDALLARRRLPMDPAMVPLEDAERWCLGGGEDFELVLALEQGWAAALQARLPGAREIGHLIPGSGQVRWLESGEALPRGSTGFTHFR